MTNVSTTWTRFMEQAADDMLEGRAIVPLLDEIAPGWQEVTHHWILGDKDRFDILSEIHHNNEVYFIRGWDMTGAINVPVRKVRKKTTKR